MSPLLITALPALLRQRLAGQGRRLLVLGLVLLVALGAWRVRQGLLAQGAQECRAQHAEAAASAAAQKEQRAQQAQAEAQRLRAENDSLRQQAEQLKKEAAHARILVPAGRGAGRTARPAAGHCNAVVAPDAGLGQGEELVLSLAAVRLWNAGLLAAPPQHPAADRRIPAGPGAAAATAAAAAGSAEREAESEAEREAESEAEREAESEAEREAAQQPSGISLNEALQNHIDNGLACRVNADRLDTLTALLREWNTRPKGN